VADTGEVWVNPGTVLQSMLVVGLVGLIATVLHLSSEVNLLTYKVNEALSNRFTATDGSKLEKAQDAVNALISQRLDTHSGILTHQQTLIDQHEAALRNELSLKR